MLKFISRANFVVVGVFSNEYSLDSHLVIIRILVLKFKLKNVENWRIYIHTYHLPAFTKD